MIKKLYITLRRIIGKIRRQNIGTYAASSAFFLFLSLGPMLALLCTVLPYTPLTERNLIAALTEFAPESLDFLVEYLVGEIYRKAAGVLSAALIITMWSAGKGLMALMQGFHVIFGLEESRNYFLVRLVSSMYTLILLTVTLLSLGVSVFGNSLVRMVIQHFPETEETMRFLIKFRFVFVWLVLTFLFALLYTFLPNRRQRFRDQIAGAMFTAVSWSIFSWFFSIYVDGTGNYSIYGSLSILAAVMLWLYFCMYLFLIGAWLNRYNGELVFSIGA